MIEMGNFSLDLLPSASFCSYKKLPNIPTIYFAISRWGQVLYVGRTKHLEGRWRNHKIISELDYLGCSKIAWIEFEETWETSSNLMTTERFFIKKYKPFLNKNQGKPYSLKKPLPKAESEKI